MDALNSRSEVILAEVLPRQCESVNMLTEFPTAAPTFTEPKSELQSECKSTDAANQPDPMSLNSPMDNEKQLISVSIEVNSQSDSDCRQDSFQKDDITARSLVNMDKINTTTTKITGDRIKIAKFLAEEAIQKQKIFSIQGGYSVLRQLLRSRGWVELFFDKTPSATVKIPKVTPPTRRKKRRNNAFGDALSDSSSESDSDEYDSEGDDDLKKEDEEEHTRPWEEENGFYGMLSRMVRQATPTFLWSIRVDAFDYDSLQTHQIVNHFKRNLFTTKVGLCTSLRDLVWFVPSNCETFFPRCYKLSHGEERQLFIDDYFMTACISLLRHLIDTTNSIQLIAPAEGDSWGYNMKNIVKVTAQMEGQTTPLTSASPSFHEAVSIALLQCTKYLQGVNQDDVDSERIEITEKQFDILLDWYYKIVHEKAPVACTCDVASQIRETLTQIKSVWPQYELDGTQNVWIVKPGAQSRGRGIHCYNRLTEILKLVDAQTYLKESKYVVQKYIERPLLIYKTKFDIRQWFLVTDWNPFTLWFYKTCYLRFCSQEFTLEDLDEAVHLSNNSIQKNYKNGERASELPEENMWTSEEFINYLCERGHAGVWENIYDGMKESVTSALLCSQDTVHNRKNSFELYGADFMLSEDLKPWLIEINSSPCMAASTKITQQMCQSVLEDTLKVVLDRKIDRNANTGLFELVERRPVVPRTHYIGSNLQVDGQAVKKPDWWILSQTESTSSKQSLATNQTVTSENPININRGKEAFQDAIRKSLTKSMLRSCDKIDMNTVAGKVRRQLDASELRVNKQGAGVRKEKIVMTLLKDDGSEANEYLNKENKITVTRREKKKSQNRIFVNPPVEMMSIACCRTTSHVKAVAKEPLDSSLNNVVYSGRHASPKNTCIKTLSEKKVNSKSKITIGLPSTDDNSNERLHVTDDKVLQEVQQQNTDENITDFGHGMFSNIASAAVCSPNIPTLKAINKLKRDQQMAGDTCRSRRTVPKIRQSTRLPTAASVIKPIVLHNGDTTEGTNTGETTIVSLDNNKRAVLLISDTERKSTIAELKDSTADDQAYQKKYVAMTKVTCPKHRIDFVQYPSSVPKPNMFGGLASTDPVTMQGLEFVGSAYRATTNAGAPAQHLGCHEYSTRTGDGWNDQNELRLSPSAPSAGPGTMRPAKSSGRRQYKPSPQPPQFSYQQYDTKRQEFFNPWIFKTDLSTNRDFPYYAACADNIGQPHTRYLQQFAPAGFLAVRDRLLQKISHPGLGVAGHYLAVRSSNPVGLEDGVVVQGSSICGRRSRVGGTLFGGTKF